MTGHRVLVTWRHKGGRKPEGVVFVGRPSRWGNPWPVEEFGRDEAIARFRTYAAERAQTDLVWLRPLEGKDLACYCKLDEDCHADVLLLMLATR